MKLTDEQVTILAKMAANADGGCLVCVKDVVHGLLRAFPEYAWPGLAFKHADFPYWTAEDLSQVPELVPELAPNWHPDHPSSSKKPL